MPAELRVEPVAQFRAGRRDLLVERDIGTRLLAAIRIGEADHHRFLDRGMMVQDRLDLAREDLEARYRQHVLQPVDDPHEAVFVDRADIAGAQPAPCGIGDEHFAIGVGPVPIALHDLRPHRDDLARLAGGRGLGRIGLVDEPQMRRRDRLADAAGLAGPLVRIGRQHARAFRQAIALDHGRPGRRFELRLQLGGERCAARDADAQRREIGLGDVGMVEQRLVHRRHAGERGRLGPRDRAEHRASLEARQHHDASAVEHGAVEHAGVGEDVE